MKYDPIMELPGFRLMEQKLADGGRINMTDEITPAWPPKGRKPGVDPVSLMKRLQARLTGARLVWLRDYDEEITLNVAKADKTGVLTCNRYWPHYRKVKLEADGRVSSENNEGDYVRHWIAVEETEQVYMFMQNHEVYAEPLKDD